MGASFLCLCEYEPSKDNETFDVRIIDKEKEFTVVVKSKCPLRNPIYKKNINHKYMNGINCIYLNYNRNEA